jgi:hypothetical protein
VNKQNFEVQNISDMKGEDEEETGQLHSYYQEAQKYLSEFNWCEEIQSSFFGFGIGGILGVFLFCVKIRKGGNENLWVVVGDLPTVYLVPDNAKNPMDALSIYCDLMDDWIRKANDENFESDVFPIGIVMNHENAELLRKRIHFIRNNILKSE